METLHFKKFIIFKFSIRIFVSSLLTMSASPTTLQNSEKGIEMYYIWQVIFHAKLSYVLSCFEDPRNTSHESARKTSPDKKSYFMRDAANVRARDCQ